MKHESGGRASAVSSAGAIGLTQLMEATARELGVNPWNPEENLMGGARYLKQMYNKFGRWDLALAAYNAGPGNVSKGYIPNSTKQYVKNVLSSAGMLG